LRLGCGPPASLTPSSYVGRARGPSLAADRGAIHITRVTEERVELTDLGNGEIARR
jgi:hypothetical protein